MANIFEPADAFGPASAEASKWDAGRIECARRAAASRLRLIGRGGEEGLDAHVLQAAPDGAGQAVPGLRLAMEALRAPAVALVEPLVLVRPALAAAAGAQERRIVVADHDRLVDPPLGEAIDASGQRLQSRGARVEEAAMLRMRLPGRRTCRVGHFSDVVLGIVAEAAQGHRARIGSALAGITASMPRRSNAP